MAAIGFIEHTFTKCSAHFCLTVALYAWCDDIPGCVGRWVQGMG